MESVDMKIVFASKTGNVRRFVGKLPGYTTHQITSDLEMDEPFLLVTHTTKYGEVPEAVTAFLEKYGKNMRGVAASGNRNWGILFAKSADKIADSYGVPIVHKFELAGTTKDAQCVYEWLEGVALS
jgi:protein involved in ribonucleotide reduction